MKTGRYVPWVAQEAKADMKSCPEVGFAEMGLEGWAEMHKPGAQQLSG